MAGIILQCVTTAAAMLCEILRGVLIMPRPCAAKYYRGFMCFDLINCNITADLCVRSCRGGVV